MSEDIPPVKKVLRKLHLANLINKDRFIRYSVILLCVAVLVVIALLLRKYNNSLKTVNIESQQPSSIQARVPEHQELTQQPALIAPTYGASESAYSQTLISADDVNSIRDMWSSATLVTHNATQKEYNLTDTAGVSIFSISGDFELTIEMYRFVNDTQMALKVAQALKEIYLNELGYQNTNLACPVAVNEPSWLLSQDLNKQLLLGKAIPNNFISIRLSSEVFTDPKDAIGLLCQILEKQVDRIKTSGF